MDSLVHQKLDTGFWRFVMILTSNRMSPIVRNQFSSYPNFSSAVAYSRKYKHHLSNLLPVARNRFS